MAASKTCKIQAAEINLNSGRQIYCSKPCKRNAEWKRSKKRNYRYRRKL